MPQTRLPLLMKFSRFTLSQLLVSRLAMFSLATFSLSMFNLTIFSNVAFATTPIVTVTSPANGSQDASPVNFTASASSPDCATGIAAMRIYTSPGNGAYTTDSDHLDVNLTLAAGSYDTVVQAWDNAVASARPQSISQLREALCRLRDFCIPPAPTIRSMSTTLIRPRA
jgi:hypothetical protein